MKEEIMVMVMHRSGMNNIKKDVLKYSSKNEYYTLSPEVELLTINFVDPKDHRRSHELF